jgi:1-deoxy-D-xylulose 5-phosphate reductoisomerase
VAVAAFLEGGIRFDEIPEIINMVLAETKPVALESIKQVLEADAEARRVARDKVQMRGPGAASRPASAVR